MNDEACPALLLVPLEASEVGLIQFVIGLKGTVSREWYEGDGNVSKKTCLLLELLVDCVQRILDCDTLEVTSSD
jgi:hypothetical protein